MKTILLLVFSLFLTSQISFAKEVNEITSVKNTGMQNFESDSNNFKNKKGKKITAVERHRIWLNLTKSGGAFRQLLLGYMTGATNGWDNIYDGTSLDSNQYIDFYSVNSGKNLTIQARALPFQVTDEVPLGYKAGVEGTYQISIDHVDGLFLNQNIFLKDISTGVIHNLKNGSYSFSTLVGRFNDRFVLLYIDNTPPVVPVVLEESVLTEVEVTDPIVDIQEDSTPIVTEPEVTDPIVDVEEDSTPIVTEPEVTDPIVNVQEDSTPIVTEAAVTDPIDSVEEVVAISVPDVKTNKGKDKSVIVSVYNGQITINSDNDDSISEIYIFNIGQRQLFSQRNINAEEFVISDLNAKKQVLIIKTQLKNGNWTTSKIVL